MDWEKALETGTTKFLKGADWVSQHTLEKLGAPMKDEERARCLIKENRRLLSRTTGKDLFKGPNTKGKEDWKPIWIGLAILKLLFLPVAFLLSLGPFNAIKKDDNE